MQQSHYDPRAFGAHGDGITDDTAAMQLAIDRSAAEGGILCLQEGSFLCGTLYLRSNLTLQINAGACLKASGDIRAYTTDTHYNRHVGEEHMDRCFLFAEDCSHITLCGEGEINGNAPSFSNPGDIHAPRPMMIRFLRCSNLVLRDLRLIDSASWTTAFLDCNQIMAEKLTIRALVNLNGDGLDFDGCSEVHIASCDICGSDDNICLQNGSRERVTRDFLIENCRLSSVCAAVRIGMKSVGDIRHVIIRDCRIERTWREGIKIESSEGGIISDIDISHLVMCDVRRPFYYLVNNLIVSRGVGQLPAPGKIERVRATNIEITDTQEMCNTHYYMWGGQKCIMGTPRFGGVRIDAQKDHPLADISFHNLRYTALGGVRANEIPPVYPEVADARFAHTEGTVANYYPDWSRAVFFDIRNVQRLALEGLYLATLSQDERPAIVLENCGVSKQDIQLYSPKIPCV